MAYSNGYNLTTVLPKLFGRLAWSTDSTLNTANKTSASGRYFDDGSFHALVTAANFKAVAMQPGTPAPSTWDAIFTARQNAVISKALNAVFNKTEFIDQVKFFTPDGSEVEQTVDNTGKAVGFKISVPRDFDKSVQLNYLELYFDGAATFNVFLFKQGSKTALQTKSVTTVANRITAVDLTDWILNYKEASTYYVVYFQSDLGSVKAIRQQGSFDNEAVLFSACPIEAAVTSGTDFDRTSPARPGEPSGLNIQASSFKDFSNNVILQPFLFDELIGLINAQTLVEEILYSVRENKTERMLKDQLTQIGLQMDLSGAAPVSDSPQIVGLKQKIDREAKRVREAFYPTVKSKTVTYADH